MKRARLVDRVAILLDRQDSLTKAAHEFVAAQGNGVAAYQREHARKELIKASVALATTLQRYLGGRSE